jgi:hypothetical protein
MAHKPTPPRDDPEQSKRFIEAALDAGPDETGEVFERAFKKMTRSTKGQVGKRDAERGKPDRHN